jgi:mRNA interferase RelE/StbE
MKMSYKVVFHKDAKKELDKFDLNTKLIILKQIKKIKENPEIGEELGNKAGFDLTGYRKIYAYKKQIRIIYKIIEEEIQVYIIAIGKREKMVVYKKASNRN